MNGIKKYLIEPWKIILGLQNHGFGKYIPDKLYIMSMYRNVLGCKLNLKNPVTFNEKLQWLKLYDRNPSYSTLVDKYSVKKYIADTIGEEYIIPTLGVWDDFDCIDFDSLPNQFVLKCTHDSGGLIICKEKRLLDMDHVRKKIESSMKSDYYLLGREWPYKNVKRRIIAEKYMKDEQTDELRDYKFYCFNGKPKFCQVISERSTNESIDFFDMDWKLQPFTGLGLPKKPHSKTEIHIPVTFSEMKRAAEKLSRNISFLRVDFYEINGKMYFGELTFYPAAGFGEFSPTEWNKTIGDLIVLP